MLKTIESLINKYNITFEQLFILIYLHTSKEKLLLYSSKIFGKYELMQNLHRRLFVKFMSGDMDNFERLEYIEFDDVGKRLIEEREFLELSNEMKDGDIDELVDKFRDKFPDGVSNQYGKRFKGNLSMVKKNLIRFKSEYKYSDETILLAAEKMVNTMVGKGKKDYISQAHYFIYHKERGCELAEECENVVKGDIIPQVFDGQI